MKKPKKQTISSYAEALLKIAGAEDSIERVEEESVNLKKILADNKLREFLHNPQIGSQEKKDALKEIFGKEGISSITSNYLNLIIDQGRERVLSDIMEEFSLLVMTERGKVAAHVTSAAPLTPDIITRLEEKLSQSTGKGVEVTAEVDESIVGGLIIRMGNKVIDASLKKQLRMVKEEMLRE